MPKVRITWSRKKDPVDHEALARKWMRDTRTWAAQTMRTIAAVNRVEGQALVARDWERAAVKMEHNPKQDWR